MTQAGEVDGLVELLCFVYFSFFLSISYFSFFVSVRRSCLVLSCFVFSCLVLPYLALSVSIFHLSLSLSLVSFPSPFLCMSLYLFKCASEYDRASRCYQRSSSTPPPHTHIINKGEEPESMPYCPSILTWRGSTWWRGPRWGRARHRGPQLDGRVSATDSDPCEKTHKKIN